MMMLIPSRVGNGVLGIGSVVFLMLAGEISLLAPRALAQTPPHLAPASALPNPLKQAEEVPPPPMPRLPVPIPAAIAPESSGIVGLTPRSGDDLGIGHLRPRDLSFLASRTWRDSPFAYARWLRSVALPIYSAPPSDSPSDPMDTPWGWLINGWLIPTGYDPIAIGRDASFSMVQAERGLYSFPVLELRPDGWFRFQYTAAGSAWAHSSHLNRGSMPLTLELWEDQLDRAARVRFFKHGLSQPLRAIPQERGALRSLVAPNSLIRPLAVDGDWMQVEVTQPARGCTSLAGATTETGWMRWRQEDESLLVWFGTEESCDL